MFITGIKATLDGAFQGSEKEGVEMAYYLLRNDGLFIGSSSALNCVGMAQTSRLEVFTNIIK